LGRYFVVAIVERFKARFYHETNVDRRKGKEQNLDRITFVQLEYMEKRELAPQLLPSLKQYERPQHVSEARRGKLEQQILKICKWCLS